MAIPNAVTCVDCGGTCHLLTAVDERTIEPGDIVSYRCSDCLDRWDIVLDADDLASNDRDM